MSYTLPTLPYTAQPCVNITVNNLQAQSIYWQPVASIYRKIYGIFFTYMGGGGLGFGCLGNQIMVNFHSLYCFNRWNRNEQNFIVPGKKWYPDIIFATLSIKTSVVATHKKRLRLECVILSTFPTSVYKLPCIYTTLKQFRVYLNNVTSTLGRFSFLP